MAQIHSIGRLFAVYGRNEWRHLKFGIKKSYVVEDTEWQPDENHRDGLSSQLHVGRWFVGGGLFNKPLSAELLDWIEDEAVWLDDVEPGDIAGWRGTRSRSATGLGYDYAVKRASDTDAEASESDVDRSAQDHG